jgi:hypothetical protein
MEIATATDPKRRPFASARSVVQPPSLGITFDLAKKSFRSPTVNLQFFASRCLGRG